MIRAQISAEFFGDGAKPLEAPLGDFRFGKKLVLVARAAAAILHAEHAQKITAVIFGNAPLLDPAVNGVCMQPEPRRDFARRRFLECAPE
ncbi:MAG: hypothetical protein MPK09_05715 [Gammaproteobacteria bacterium]|nr:hypothetical protein [Gammaproteobacteria bacterium]